MENEFPVRLRRLRRGVGQYVLAQLCGIKNDDAIRRYENGDTEPGMGNLIKIADYFEVSIDYLVGRTDNPSINK